jgi:hypothetical protein
MSEALAMFFDHFWKTESKCDELLPSQLPLVGSGRPELSADCSFQIGRMNSWEVATDIHTENKSYEEIYAAADPENTLSTKVLEKAGFFKKELVRDRYKRHFNKGKGLKKSAL